MLDQFTQNGKSSLFLVNPVNVSSDSFIFNKGDAVAYPANNELDELFFKYGVRLNKDIVTDLYSAPIVLAQGEYNESEYRPIRGYIIHSLNPKTTIQLGVLWEMYFTDL